MEITSKVSSAIDFAWNCHKNQVDKSGKPYFYHVLRVALRVADLGESFLITALLHDTIEDCGILPSEINEKFGEEITNAVISVTRQTFPYKETYMSLIERASQNKIGREVKLADLEDNMMPERIASLPPEQRDILKRYERAKKHILISRENISL